MNVLDRQARLMRELIELQTSSSQSLTDLFANSVRQYVELNQDFAKRLPTGADMTAWADLSREYGEALWTNYREHLESRGEIMKQAMDKSGEAFSAAYGVEERQAPTAVEAVAA